MHLFILPPLPPRELFGPKVVSPKCAITLWGALGLPLGPSRALLGSPWAPPRGPRVHNPPPKTCRHLPSICRPPFFLSFRRTSHLFTKSPLQKQYKNQRIFTVFEIAISVSFSYFCNLWASEGPSRPPLGERSGPFWAPLPPLKFRNGLLGAPGPSRGSLSGCHSLTLGQKKMGLRQQRKTQFYNVKTILLEKHGFETPPVNDWHSIWVLFLFFSSAPWLLFWF